MKRNYLKLYGRYILINFKSILVYDLDYIFGIIAMMIKNAVNFCMLLLLFQLVDQIKGWSFEQMLFLYGMSTISYALWHCLFIDVITIPTYIQTGEFDRFLLKPVDPLFQIMMEGFDEDGWGELFFGVIVLITSIVRMDGVSVWKMLVLPIFCVAGMLIFAALSIFCSSVAFYTVGNIDLTSNVMDFQEFAKYPLSIFSKPIQGIFTFLIPIGFVAYYPGIAFMSDTAYLWGMLTLPVAIVFFVVAWKWWHYALKKYSSSGH